MDIDRAVEDFVVLRTQLHILTIETGRLKSKNLMAKTMKAIEQQSNAQLETCAHARAIDELGSRLNQEGISR